TTAQFPERVSEDRWHQPWSDPVRRLSSHAAQPSVAFVAVITSTEVVTVDKWFIPLSDPVRKKPDLGAYQHQYSAATLGLLPLRDSYWRGFRAPESMLSQVGHWVDGGAPRFLWTNPSTQPGLVYGTQTGTNGFDDSVAHMTGTWPADQVVEATVHSVNQQG